MTLLVLNRRYGLRNSSQLCQRTPAALRTKGEGVINLTCYHAAWFPNDIQKQFRRACAFVRVCVRVRACARARVRACARAAPPNQLFRADVGTTETVFGEITRCGQSQLVVMTLAASIILLAAKACCPTVHWARSSACWSRSMFRSLALDLAASQDAVCHLLRTRELQPTSEPAIPSGRGGPPPRPATGNHTPHQVSQAGAHRSSRRLSGGPSLSPPWPRPRSTRPPAHSLADEEL